MSSSTLALLFSLTALGMYGYSAYFMLHDANLIGRGHSISIPLQSYGLLRYLTFQCLCIQILNLIIHIVAHFVSSLRKPRDIFFTALAHPIGFIVVFRFWGIWHLFGRELILPEEVSDVFPDWLNHVTHTSMVPVNLILSILLHHDNGSRLRILIPLIYYGSYSLLLEYIKKRTGHYVYPYLETMNQPVRIFFYLSTGALAYLAMKTGRLIDDIFHSKPTQRPLLKKTKTKQK